MIVKKTLKEAISRRSVSGFRFDNSKYWKKYYLDKLGNKNFTREYEYAVFISKLIDKKSKILDIATGYGFLPVELFKLGLKTECVDKYPKMINLANEYFKKNNFKTKIYKADVTKLPVKDSSYDLVTAQSILEHFCLEELEKKLIPEIKRVIKNKGWILIHVPIKSGVSIFKKYYRKYITKDLPKWAIDDDGDATHKIWLSTSEYLKELLEQGLKVEYIRFNFIRSNETIGFMKFFDRILESLGGSRFHKIDDYSKFKLKLLSSMGISIVIVCKKK